MIKSEIREVIAHRIFAGDFLSLKGADLEDASIATEECLALMQKLVASKKNMPELMLSEYGKGQNAVVDDLLSELK